MTDRVSWGIVTLVHSSGKYVKSTRQKKVTMYTFLHFNLNSRKRVYLCRSSPLCALMHCGICNILHVFNLEMLGAGWGLTRGWCACKAAADPLQKILETSQLMRRVNAKGWGSTEKDGSQLPLWHQGLPSTCPGNSFSGSWSYQAAGRVRPGSAFCAGMADSGDMGTVVDMSCLQNNFWRGLTQDSHLNAEKHGLDEGPGRQIGGPLTFWTQK